MPRHDNLAQAGVLVTVHPDHRRRGAGTALLAHVEAAALEHSRTVFLAETQWRVGARDEGGEDFAAAHGYAGAQTVLRSSLSLPADRARLEAAVQAGVEDGYVVRTCWDGIPESWLAGRAELSRRMSTDIPMGDLVLEEESWDEERVRTDYQRIAAIGRRVIDAYALHEATRELVGYTQVQVPQAHPQVAFQQDTLVLREHRGHGLGLRMKAAVHAGPHGGFARDDERAHLERRRQHPDARGQLRARLRARRHDARVAEGRRRVMENPLDVDLGVVSSIHVAKATRLPMRPVESVVAEAGVGLVGDRYHGSKHRHVTVQSALALADATRDLGLPVEPGATRRNITVSGGPVPGRPGTRVRMGEALLEVVRPAAPCRLMDDHIAPGAMKALHARGGTVFRILEGAVVRVGDPVVLEGS